jgi:predicted TIM-barrel fold metal-dependent hydrolase
MSENKPKIIDCDVHVRPRNSDEIKAYLNEPWKHRFQLRKNYYYKNPLESAEKKLQGGSVPASDPCLVRSQLINPLGLSHAILIPQAHVTANHDPDYSTAVAAAYNLWLADTWLGQYNEDGVFKGTILISHQDPIAAATLIERFADHPHFIQVLMESGARAPFGQRHYNPIYEACERHKLPVVIHPGAEGMGVNKPVWQGYPSHYIEYYTGFSFAMQSHLVSLLTEGVFERFPGLKVVIAEGGVIWLPALMWRLDMEWKALRSEVPWVRKLPSEYLKDHVRFTTQPLERSANDQDLMEVLDMMNADRLLMFSSDYPDGDFTFMESLLPQLQEAWRKKILHENAEDWYSL